MDPLRIAATLLLVLGLILLLAGPLIPGDKLLVPTDLPAEDHVTVLAAGDGGTILAATQAGEVWRFKGRQWVQEKLDLGQRVITALSGEPARHPVGTASGLWHPPGAPLPGNPRVADILESDQGLVLATGDGIRVFAAGTWHQPTPAMQSYRLQEQRRDGSRYLHVGTIGDGVFSVPVTSLLGAWQPNSQGLPAAIKVLSFAVTEGGLLLAGTDQGLYWQTAPGQTWQRIDAGLGNRRILALYRAPAAGDGAQRLWIGSDEGLLALDLTESPGGLDTRGPARAFAAQRETPEVAVSWIVPLGNHLMISAGTVYELKGLSYPGWYLISLAGLGLMIGGGWLGSRKRTVNTTI